MTEIETQATETEQAHQMTQEEYEAKMAQLPEEVDHGMVRVTRPSSSMHGCEGIGVLYRYSNGECWWSVHLNREELPNRAQFEPCEIEKTGEIEIGDVK